MEYKFAPIEAEIEADGTITGYGSKFGIVDQGNDIVVKGAFAETLKGSRKVKMLWQHDPSRPIGVWSDLVEDEVGLKMTGQINLEVNDGREAHSLLKQGAIEGLSIGYVAKGVRKAKTGERELTKLDLHEVSLVTFPMLPEAVVESVKGISDTIELKRFVERLLREADLSASEAKAAAAAVARVREEREVPTDTSAMLEIQNALRGL